MSVECTMYAIAADRYETLRADPVAVTNEVASVQAGLDYGDFEPPLAISSNWDYLNEIMTDGEEPTSPAHFILGGTPLGEDVGYGPARLHDPAAVAAFAAHLDMWSPERFAAAAEARIRAKGEAATATMEKLRAIYSEAREAMYKETGVDIGFDSNATFFMHFKTCIVDAAAARAGMLVWMS
jgi:Domain of unknown function (DUF1877)